MFRFTIRELVLLTLVVAMGVAWWVDRQRLDAALLDSRHAQAVAKRHRDEYRSAYIELRGAVEQDGFTIPSRTANVVAKRLPSVGTSETISPLP